MSDDGYTASELRQRYERGGSVQDCDLSAAQLRARYAIPNNTFKPDKSQNNMMLIVGAVIALVVLAGAAYMFTQ
ncbi:hypothetical protein PINS_up009213 [Pythium insidiosum]|nr:hypothetical protein PINS_up009213 [Pythium insidiosum]